MAKASNAVQGFAGQMPIGNKANGVGVSGFDHVTIEADGAINATIDYLNWEESQAMAKGEKLKGIIKAISALTHDGHIAYRRKLGTIRELAKGANDDAKENAENMGYSAASFTVMISNFSALSKAFQAGWAYDDSIGWVKSLAIARAYTKMQASAKGEPVENKGRKVRVELPVVDKIMALIGELNEAEMAEFTMKLGATYDLRDIEQAPF